MSIRIFSNKDNEIKDNKELNLNNNVMPDAMMTPEAYVEGVVDGLNIGKTEKFQCMPMNHEHTEWVIFTKIIKDYTYVVYFGSDAIEMTTCATCTNREGETCTLCAGENYGTLIRINSSLTCVNYTND